MLKIVNDYPPNHERIKQVLNFPSETCFFCYGDTIYNPGNLPITADIMIHEGVHSRQQGDNPDKWWEKYLTNVNFRKKQEVEAYRAQLKFWEESLANVLSGPVYGYMMSKTEALWEIRG